MTAEWMQLQDYRLAPAPVDRFRRPPPQVRLRVPLRGGRDEGATSPTIPLPAFWYDPPWHRAELERCQVVADAVGRLGVTIGALQSELSDKEGAGEEITWSRLAPHRCDRAGWSIGDFQNVAVIELRLGMNRDAAGAYAYSPGQVARWNMTGEASGQPPRQRCAPLLFPPEWPDLLGMKSKVAQLRALSDAAVYVSCDEAVLEEVMTGACAAQADGVILRCEADPVAALERSAAILDASDLDWRPQIWLAGGPLTPMQAVKCYALGAAAVSIDSLCNGWLLGSTDEPLSSAERAAMKLGVNVGQSPEERLQTQIRRGLQNWTAQVAAIIQSLLVHDVAQVTSGHLRCERRGSLGH